MTYDGNAFRPMLARRLSPIDLWPRERALARRSLEDGPNRVSVTKHLAHRTVFDLFRSLQRFGV